jgi:hypothetical protein
MADISNELDAIEIGRYGVDIRMAIHDALEKIAVYDTARPIRDVNGYRMKDSSGHNIKGRS